MLKAKAVLDNIKSDSFLFSQYCCHDAPKYERFAHAFALEASIFALDELLEAPVAPCSYLGMPHPFVKVAYNKKISPPIARLFED